MLLNSMIKHSFSDNATIGQEHLILIKNKVNPINCEFTVTSFLTENDFKVDVIKEATGPTRLFNSPQDWVETIIGSIGLPGPYAKLNEIGRKTDEESIKTKQKCIDFIGNMFGAQSKFATYSAAIYAIASKK